jgi:hypothetical protein
MDGPTATQINFAIAGSGNNNAIRQSPQKPNSTEKYRFNHPRKMFRLEQGPFLYFQSLTRHFN